MTFWKSLGLTALFAVTAIATAPRVEAQAPVKITVRPLVRSIHFQIDPTILGGTLTGATIEWRVPGGIWKPGLPFVRTSTTVEPRYGQNDPRWGTILPGAVEGATYEYRVTCAGTPHDAGDPLTGTVTTLSATEPTHAETVISLTPASNVHDVVMANLSPIAANNRGKVFEFAAGTYRQSPFRFGSTHLDRGGDALGWVIFRPAPGAAGQVIFDGSNPTFDVINAAKWTKVITAGVTGAMNIWKAAYTSDPGHIYWDTGDGKARRLMWWSRNQFSGSDSQTFWSSGLITEAGYAAAHGKSYDDSLQARATTYPAEGAYCYEGGYLYVHLQNGVDPNTVKMKIPTLPAPWAICQLQTPSPTYPEVYGVKTQGITFQYFGPWSSTSGSTEQKGGIGCSNVNRLVYEDVIVKGFGTTAFYALTSGYINNVIYKNCHVLQYGLDPSSGSAVLWNHVKLSASESSGWLLKGNGISIIDSSCVGVFNGIATVSYWSSGYGGPQLASACPYWEIDNVAFVGIGDDCLEPEGFTTSYIASRCSMAFSYKGISLAPIYSGPVLLLRNTFYSAGNNGTQYKTAATKIGNYGGEFADTAYKLLAHNTFVNAHDDWVQRPGVGFSSSGGSQNVHIINNYSYSDILGVDFADGALGYPHTFDHNWYGLRRYGVAQPGLGGQAGRWALSRGADTQGETLSDVYRRYTTFLDWQQGRNNSGSGNMPGYVAGVTPQKPVDSGRGGTWLHDPHSAYEARATHGLVAPEKGDYSLEAGSKAIGLGGPLNTINTNCLPGWAKYEEAHPSAGAYPGAAGTVTPHLPPTLKLTDGITGTPGTTVSVPMTYAASEGVITSVVSGVTGPDGAEATSTLAGKTATGAAVTFTPIMVGTYSVMGTVMDDRGSTTSAQTTVVISPTQLPGGSITVTLTPSTRTARPGEPVVYTVVIANPTTRAMKDVMLKQQIPAEVTLNMASAMLDGKPATLSVKKNLISVSLGTMAANTSHTLTVTAVVN